MSIAAALLLLLVTQSGCAVRSNISASDNAFAPPDSESERVARCERYQGQLELTRSQLRQRNAVGSLDLVRDRHRMMERFVDQHCR